MTSRLAARGIGAARDARTQLGLPLDEPLPDALAVVEERAGVPVVLLELEEGLGGAYLFRRGRPRAPRAPAPPAGARAQPALRVRGWRPRARGGGGAAQPGPGRAARGRGGAGDRAARARLAAAAEETVDLVPLLARGRRGQRVGEH